MALPLGSIDHGIFDLHLGIDEKILRSLLVFIFLAVALFLANYVFVRVTFRHARIRRMLEGRPRVLLRNGTLDREAMRKEAITEEELVDQLLDKGMESIDKIGLIILETNGKLVFLTPGQAKRLRPDMLAVEAATA